MSQEIVLPGIENDGQEITLETWLKKPGDVLKVGDIIAEAVTDKANVEIETPLAGTLEALLVQEGEVVVVGQPIARVTAPQS